MGIKMKEKELTSIINSLSAGVVPNIGVRHIAVGRELEIKAFTQALDEVKNGHSLVKFWIGDFGSGKSFMFHLLNTIAIKQKFVVSNVDFAPNNRLYADDGKSLLLYSSIMDNISIKKKTEGGALPSLLDEWIEKVVFSTAREHNIPMSDIISEKYFNLIQENIMATVNEVTEIGGFDFGLVIIKYYEGYIKRDDFLRRSALKWLKGEYRIKTEARNDLGVREIVNDSNYYDMLKNFCRFFVHIGYSGFMINLDEAVNLYKISNPVVRAKNYEKILTIFNDCFQGRVSNMFINFAGTKEFLESERRGLFSYDALKTRLKTNRFETLEYRDLSQPVIKLVPLSQNEIFVLLKKLKEIFDMNFGVNVDIDDKDIHIFMEKMFNKPGAGEFLMPREVIRDFIGILNILIQNPNVDKKVLISDVEIRDERADVGIDCIAEIDSIEEI